MRRTNKKQLLTICLFFVLLIIFAYSICISENHAAAEEIESASGQVNLYLANTYSVIYHLNGGTNNPSNPTSFSTSDSNYTLQPATRSGYKFLGWYQKENFTKYTTTIKPASASGDINLYAKWAEYVYIPVKYSYTDFYSTFNDTVGYVQTFYNDVYYYDNLTDCANMVSGHSSYTIYASNGATLSTSIDEYGYWSNPNTGTPSYIVISSDPYYSVSYELNGGSIPSGYTPYNYYYVRADLTHNGFTPTKDNSAFVGWFLDASFTKTMYTSSFTPTNITLYAKWAPYEQINAYITTTDLYTKTTTTIDIIGFYEEDGDYLYSENYRSLYDNYTEYEFNVYTDDDIIIPIYVLEGTYRSHISYGKPSYIKYETPIFYSIEYVLGDDVYFNDGEQLYNYYFERADLGDLVEPKKDNALFVGWFLDDEYTTSFYTSSFTPHDITLYAKWKEYKYAPVYYFDSSLDIPDYTHVGDTYYYETDYDGFCVGYLDDTSRQIPYYFSKYDVKAYKVIDSNDKEAHIYNNSGYMYAKCDGDIKCIYIYKHYSVKYYVNGIYYYETHGDKDAKIEIPNAICGFIGENYDAAHIGPFTMGKSYALYIMKGWSLTDTSDITWFNKTEVDILSSNLTYGSLDNGEYVVSLYAYMTFYGKLNSKNSNIDYDAYILETNGLVTTASNYSLDDLMQEHVTEISSDSQQTNVDKLLKYFKLDSLGSSSLNLLKKIFNGEVLSFDDFWNSTLGKIFIISILLCVAFIVIFNAINFAKALSKIQSKS